MTRIGEFSLFIGFTIAVYTSITYLIAAIKRRPDLMKSAENATHSIFAMLVIASISLIYAFLSRDFSIMYVYNYSNRELSWFYTISAFWAGQKGSLLLWSLLLSIFSSIVLIQNRYKNRDIIPYAMAVMMIILTFFLFLLSFSTNPFEKMPSVPEDGHGLNPMLQNPGMIFHPPALYLGYVGFSVPFAFAVAALITGQLGDLWIRTTRHWTIFSWFFLTMGNLLGAQWAYVELGWGGYWAWDPVENASFMPWLVGTAYLHSVMIQEKKEMLKIWNMVLIILTFCLTIFGTFITRSGLIQSVHAFDETTLGYYFLAFLFITLFSSVGLIIFRYPLLKSNNILDSFLSRESSFLFNNLLLLGATFATFWGTIFPVISEAVRGVKITVGPPFYNQVNVPIGLALLFLIGVCPLIAWRKATVTNLKKNFLTPFIIAIIGEIIIFLIIGTAYIYAHLSFFLSIFVTATIIQEFYKGVRARMGINNESALKAIGLLIWRNKRRYGGYIIHLGVVLIYIGISGSSSFSTEVTKTLRSGESMIIKDYKLTYEGISSKQPNPTKEEIIAYLTVEKNGKNMGRIKPEKDFWKNENQPSTEVAILSSIVEDLYVIFAEFQEDNSATFKVLVNPLVQWLWIGGWVVTIGAIIAMWPDKIEKKRLSARYAIEI